MHRCGPYSAKYCVNLSCNFVFTTTLTYAIYLQAHFDPYNCDRLSNKGTAESYRNELQLQKLHSNI